MKKSKISNVEWWLFIGALGTVDLVQIVLDLFAIGVAANRFVDIAVGMTLAFYLIIRGEEVKPTFILATFGLEMIPVVDVLPFWLLDGFYYKHQAKLRNMEVDEAERAAAEEADMKASAEKEEAIRRYEETA